MTRAAFAAEVATWMAVLPFAWLVFLRARWQPVPVAAWWLSGAFAVSCVADNVARFVDPWIVSATYPVSQAAVIGAVLLTGVERTMVLGSLVTVAVASVLMFGANAPELLLRTVAFATVCGMVVDRPAFPFRASLLVYFGGGLLTWYAYAWEPGWTTWILYQSTRALGLVLFCVAARDPKPKLLIG